VVQDVKERIARRTYTKKINNCAHAVAALRTAPPGTIAIHHELVIYTTAVAVVRGIQKRRMMAPKCAMYYYYYCYYRLNMVINMVEKKALRCVNPNVPVMLPSARQPRTPAGASP